MSSVYDEILEFNADRLQSAVAIKLERMNESSFAFFRGTDHLFARAWSEAKGADPGPCVFSSGDLHLENFGAYQTEEGDFRFDINDFDEALNGPCSFDVTRCATSIILAAETWKLAPLAAVQIALAYLDQYRAAVQNAVKDNRAGEIAPRSGTGPVWDLLNETARGDRIKLLDHYSKKGKHGIRQIERIQDKRPQVTDEVAAAVKAAVESFGRTTRNPDAFKVLDVTGRLAGIGSLGVRRYVALIEGDGSPDGNRLLDIKEGRPSSVVPFVDAPQPVWKNEAERVVTAQRRLQSKPIAGLAVLEIDGTAYRMRELVSDENRSKLDRLQSQPEKLLAAVQVAGDLTAWSHFRGAEESQRQSLAAWVGGAGIEAILAIAARLAVGSQAQFAEFQKSYRPPKATAGRK